MKYTQILKRAFFAFSVVGMIAIPVIADFTPTSPAFPHGSGIVREDGGCSASTDNKCYNGLTFPSFNSFTDSKIDGKSVEGITDERRFLVTANLGPDGKTTAVFKNTVSANVGDIILTRAYIHNNAKADYTAGNATNVKIGMTGFSNAGSGYHYSSAGTSVTLNQFTSADNTTPTQVTDDSFITSANGSVIKLLFYETENAIQSTVNPKTINQANFFSGGSNIGTVEGCSDDSFYVYTYMRVVSGEPPSYDLKINKYVGKDQTQVDAKTYTGANPISLSVGDPVYYRIDYQNLSTSTATPVGTKIYDDYDETKLDIVWIPSTCTNDGSKITCTATDLSPNQSTYLYYVAKIKTGVAANTIIQNAAEIKPTTDADTNQANDTTYAQVKVLPGSYDLKINKYVGKDQTQADTKTYTGTNTLSLKAGDFAYYRIDYENLSISTATPVGTKVYDDYDQTKVAIHWLPDACSHDGDKITCTGYDLSPGQYHTFYYIAKIKTDVVANTVIINNAEVKPTTDADTNDANDHTNAQVKIIESGVCGGGAKTYPATTTAYPSGTVFCAKGTANPSSPAFPAQGQSVSWNCISNSGGENATCTANREVSVQYDLKIDKYVGKDRDEADTGKKEIVAQPGGNITYKLFYQNLSSSAATPVGTRIYDDYDETKITILSKPSECTDDGTKLTCVAYDLQPSQSHMFYYTAQVKAGVESGAGIVNIVEIKPTTDNDTNQSNDTSSAKVTVNAPLAGECGTPARTYSSEETQYPAGSVFCNKGTADPSSPSFPLQGQTVTWICKGVNGGTDRTCQANRLTSSIDVNILKSASPTSTIAGSTVTYSLKYQNLTSGTTATGTIIKDFFDNAQIEESSFQFNTPSGVSCVVTQDPDPLVAVVQGKFIQCTIGTLAASDGQKTITYTARIKSTVAAGGTITNTAKIAATNEDGTKLGNNTASAVVTITSSPVNGQCNTNVSKTYSASDTAYPSGQSFCTTGTANPSSPAFPAQGQSVSWACSGLNGGSATTCTANRLVATPTIDIAILKSVSPIQTMAGSTVTYTLRYQNLTPGTISTGTVIRDFIDNNNIDLTSLQFSPPSGVSCVVTQDPDPLVAIIQGKFIQCTVGNLAYTDGQKVINYTAKIISTTTNGTTITNTAKIAATNEDGTKLGNNTASAVVTITSSPVNGQCNTNVSKTYSASDTAYPSGQSFCTTGTANPSSPAFPAQGQSVSWTCSGLNGGSATTCTANRVAPLPLDVTVLKSVNPTQTTAGSLLTYTVKYKNLTDNTTATGVVLRDFIDNTNLDFSTLQITPPSGVTCTLTEDPDPLIAIYQDKFIQCTVGNLSYTDGEKTITYTVRVKSTSTASSILNTVKIAATNEDTSRLANNTANAVVTLISSTPVPVCGTAARSHSSSESSYSSGSTFCSVGSSNPSSPAFPAQGQSVSWTCTNGTQVISCSASRSSSSGGGSSGGGSGGGCNTYSAIDLNIAKYVKLSSGEFVLANSRDAALQIAENKNNTVTYKVVVTNAGDASAYEVVVSDSFSSESGMEQSNIKSISGATYSSGKFSIVQPVGVGGKQEFIYSATVNASESSIGKNTAKIESFTHSYKCPKISSEKGVGRTSVAYVKSGGDINSKEGGYLLTKNADKQVVKAGDIVTYTLTLKNTGDTDMKDVVLSDRFPAEFLEPTEEYTSLLINDRLLQFKQKFLPAGAEMSQVVKMKVREGVPKGTEMKNTLTAASSNFPMNDTADAIVLVGESTVARPTCPAGYSLNAKTNKCVKKWIKTTPKSGPEAPILALGISFLGIAIFTRRREIAQWITK